MPIGATASPGGQEEAVEALLRLHHEQRVAHVLRDVASLTSLLTDSVVEIGRGRIVTRTPAQARVRFGAYFAEVRFPEWEDVRPPVIRLSPDGRWAEVVVEKRVRTIPSDTTRSKRQDASVFAWISRWARTGAIWRMAMIASTERPGEDTVGADLASRVRAYEILRRARDAVGGEEAVARIATLRFSAECEGPDGRFVTEVASARDGRVAFSLQFSAGPPFVAGVSLDGPWRLTEHGVVDTLGAVLETVLSAHELHLLAIAPEARYASPRARSAERVQGREVDVVRFTDRLGAPVDFLYDAATGRPAGFRVVNHTGRGAPKVITSFADWRRAGEIHLPFEITIEQGNVVYRYRVTAASTEWLTDAVFRPAGRISSGPSTADPPAPAANPANLSRQALPDSGRVFDERVAVFMEASAREIDRVRSERSQEDFYVIADDLMFYRAAAHEYIEAHGVPVVRVVGRRRLTFLVAGRPQRYDFSGEPTLDLVVLYEPGRQPKALAPAGIHEAAEYYGFNDTLPAVDR